MTFSTIPIYTSPSSSDDNLKQLSERTTAYEKIRMIYSRDDKSMLSFRQFRYKLKNSSHFIDSILPKSGRIAVETDFFKIKLEGDFVAWEFNKGEIWSGLLTENSEMDTQFEKWFIYLLASTASVDFPCVSGEEYEEYTARVSAMFVSDLKNTTEFDEWNAGGEAHFKEVVDFFTSRGVPIEAVLPAFPCKSSNLKKVASQLPDLGEELALSRLINFAASVKEIYPPGIKIWIVSDGHVFSDCVAVDDDMVDTYSKALKELYESLTPNEFDPIQFCSLVDIFSLKKTNFDGAFVANVEISHYLNTKIDEEAEYCRKVLVASCDTDSGELKNDISTPNHPRLFLFRGFSRFMTEDLQTHPIIGQVSRKKFKKIVAKVAFEMIKRNDAYSNLVELVFPFHLRFSIHAHKNNGPKYGIQLLASQDCFVINSLDDHMSPNLSDLLHIPTPWHNTIVEIDDKKTLYVIKSEEVYNGYKNGKGEGSWNSEKLCFQFKSLHM